MLKFQYDPNRRLAANDLAASQKALIASSQKEDAYRLAWLKAADTDVGHQTC